MGTISTDIGLISGIDTVTASAKSVPGTFTFIVKQLVATS